MSDMDKHHDTERCYSEPRPTAPMPRTCHEAGKFCVDQCTLQSAWGPIVDPDCFRGPKGRERLAKWRAERAADDATSCSEHATEAQQLVRDIASRAPIQLAQCGFCGGPGHAYGERCGRQLSGRPHGLTSPSARLASASTTVHAVFIQSSDRDVQLLAAAVGQALEAIHDALADLYTGRL